MASMAPPEDDPVVCEIPVHLAENLRGQLCVSLLAFLAL